MMSGFKFALWSEFLKVRRSKMLWITMAAFAFLAVMMGVLVYVSNHPGLVDEVNMINVKASILGAGSWPDYLRLLILTVAMIGLIGFGFVASWIFGREYTDRTMKDLLALPVRRTTIVFAKYIVMLAWSILLSLIFLIVGLAAGFAAGIKGWDGSILLQTLRVFSVTSVLTILLCSPLPFFASCGKGFLLPLGFLILTMISSQFIGVGMPAIAPYFPWSVPALYGSSIGDPPVHVGIASYLVVIAASFTGVLLTLFWWKYTDHT